MVIYHHIEVIGKLSLPPICLYNIYDHQNYYLVEPVNIHIRSIINIIQENNWFITTKNGKVKLPLFRSNGEQVITFYVERRIVIFFLVSALTVGGIPNPVIISFKWLLVLVPIELSIGLNSRASYPLKIVHKY